MRRQSSPSPGEIRSLTSLGTTASYEILEVTGRRVRAAVVSAPGLASGTEMWLTADAVLGMQVAATPADASQRASARVALV